MKTRCTVELRKQPTTWTHLTIVRAKRSAFNAASGEVAPDLRRVVPRRVDNSSSSFPNRRRMSTSRPRSLELCDQEVRDAGKFRVSAAGVDEMDLIAFGLELFFEEKTEHSAVRGVGLGLAFHRRLVLRRVGHEDRRVTWTDVGIGRILLDPVEHVGAVVEELLEL